MAGKPYHAMKSTTASIAFKAQSQKDSKASLPKMRFGFGNGFTAAKPIKRFGRWILGVAFAGTKVDLRYFSADAASAIGR